MAYTYGATMEFDHEDGGWLVSFPDFEGAVAFGETVTDACEAASEVLRLFIAQTLDEGHALPQPSTEALMGHCFTVDVSEAYRLRTRCVTPSEAARELGVSAGRVSQLMADGRLSAVEADGRRLVTIESVEAYGRDRRGAGRPPARDAIAALA